MIGTAIKGAMRAASIPLLLLGFVFIESWREKPLPWMWICLLGSACLGGAAIGAADANRRANHEKVMRWRPMLVAVVVSYVGTFVMYRFAEPHIFRPGIDDPSFPLAAVSGFGAIAFGFLLAVVLPIFLDEARPRVNIFAVRLVIWIVLMICVLPWTSSVTVGIVIGLLALGAVSLAIP